ncbi:CRISPR-associated endonuclease Cas1, partial [Ruminococcaceae bacterium OttesenSCG-928-L11]|nr:CRISPR-associated endonuclease Cas1 [Ruminococcaceae bacterium OttesenSCG-928-L11]
MRMMQNTLYVTTPDIYLALDGENVVLRRQGEELHRLPLHNLEGIIAFGYTGASPALMGECAQRGIGLTFLTMHGRFLARVVGESHGNVLLRKQQYAVSSDEAASARIARPMLKAKLYNSRSVLQRAMRDHALRIDVEKLRHAADRLTVQIGELDKAKSLESLRGVEGIAAAAYFSVADDLLLQQKEHFAFTGRNRRP